MNDRHTRPAAATGNPGQRHQPDHYPYSPLVVIPTYNEARNLPLILNRLHHAVADAHVLIVDDNSPDGTGDIADRIAGHDHRVHCLHRPGKDGLAAAYLAGFTWALERDYDAVIEMDADGSHSPEDLPRMFHALHSADLVLGSRWVTGGTVHNWPRKRLLLSRAGNAYARIALGIDVRDVTGGYRVFRSEVLRKLDLTAVDSQGYCFQVDLAWRAINAGFTVTEVPITFTERQYGESKMSGSIVGEALLNVTRWALHHRLNALHRNAAGLRSRTRW